MGKTDMGYTNWSWTLGGGCCHPSPGCLNCWAARMAATRLRHHPRYEGLAVVRCGRARWTGEVREAHDKVGEPLRLRKPRSIAVGFMFDLFHPDIDYLFQKRVFDVMGTATHHAYWVTTKFANVMAAFLLWYQAHGYTENLPAGRWPWPHVRIMVSAENQEYLDARAAHLVRAPAIVRLLNLEPLLEAVTLKPWLDGGGIHGVIFGGEATLRCADARPFRQKWAGEIISDVLQANFGREHGRITAYLKQMGTWWALRHRFDNLRQEIPAGNPASVYARGDRHGRDWDSIPWHIKVRSLPTWKER